MACACNFAAKIWPSGGGTCTELHLTPLDTPMLVCPSQGLLAETCRGFWRKRTTTTTTDMHRFFTNQMCNRIQQEHVAHNKAAPSLQLLHADMHQSAPAHPWEHDTRRTTNRLAPVKRNRHAPTLHKSGNRNKLWSEMRQIANSYDCLNEAKISLPLHIGVQGSRQKLSSS